MTPRGSAELKRPASSTRFCARLAVGTTALEAEPKEEFAGPDLNFLSSLGDQLAAKQMITAMASLRRRYAAREWMHGSRGGRT